MMELQSFYTRGVAAECTTPAMFCFQYGDHLSASTCNTFRVAFGALEVRHTSWRFVESRQAVVLTHLLHMFTHKTYNIGDSTGN